MHLDRLTIALPAHARATGDLAAAMASAPQNRPEPAKTEPAKKINRFAAVFGAPWFEHLAQRGEPLIFKSGRQAGTKQWQLAEVYVPLGETGAVIQGGHIVYREYPNDGGSDLLFVWPSFGGAFKKSMLNVKDDENAALELIEYNDGVVAQYVTAREAQLVAGKVNNGIARNVATKVTPDLLARLGFKPTTTTTTTPTTTT